MLYQLQSARNDSTGLTGSVWALGEAKFTNQSKGRENQNSKWFADSLLVIEIS